MNTSIASKLCRSFSGLVFVAASVVASAHAQNSDHRIKVAIPFAFGDGRAHLSPGVYTMGVDGTNILLIRNAKGAPAVLTMVNTGDVTAASETGRVVFHKYGDRYFLSQVWLAGSTSHLEFPRSKAERNLQRELQLAANRQAPNGTEVALLELPH